MTHRVRLILKVSTASLLALSITACSASGKTNTNTSANVNVSNQTASEKTNEPVELVIYSESGWSQEEFNERFGDSIRKKFPQHTFKYITKQGAGPLLPEVVASGTNIDIYWDAVSKIFTNLKDMKLEYDMSDMIKKRQMDLNKLEPSTVEYAKQSSDGKMYALPVVINTQALYYNKDIFDRFGVPYPKDGMTWDEILDLGKKFNKVDGGTEYYGIGLYNNQYLVLNPFSLSYVDPKTEKATIQNEKWKPVYDVLTKIYQTAGNKMRSPTFFTKDKNIAMTVALGNYFLTPPMADMNWDIVSFPKYKEAPNLGPQTLPTYFSITSTSKHKELAMDVIQHILSDEKQTELSRKGIIPVLTDQNIKKQFGESSPHKGKNLQTIVNQNYSSVAPKTKYDTNAEKIYLKYDADLATGKMDLNTAFRQIEEETNNMIAKEKGVK
ncbi:extracellular solute-binding protein [Paenibacillus sp. RC67]|uniref:ABC transporter substrate-binding protein n=1 Tax=Paenibacillus sp. RC67 TaxID=3039392 RepID=UPI0024AC87BF|nr:extracellular solute-binding protein [Paenibacillus sp. RC67]